jgi:hypothetical protein
MRPLPELTPTGWETPRDNDHSPCALERELRGGGEPALRSDLLLRDEKESIRILLEGVEQGGRK